MRLRIKDMNLKSVKTSQNSELKIQNRKSVDR